MITTLLDYEDLSKAVAGVTTSHFTLNDFTYKDQLDAVHLTDDHIFCDYTIDEVYYNMYKFFGEKVVKTNQLINNYFKPSLIFHTKKVQKLLSTLTFDIQTAWELTFAVITYEETISVDGHVVFNFNSGSVNPSLLNPFIHLISERNDIELNDKINRFICFHQMTLSELPSLPVRDNYYLLPDRLKINKYMPWLYPKLYRWFFKRKQSPYSLANKKTTLKNHIVFLGFDYHFRGNSKYLYNAIIELKNNQAGIWKDIDIYFISLDDEKFIEPNSLLAKTLIETARVVILESFKPDNVTIHGITINLWHGIPIKRLFLDSKEPYQNQNIFLYRLRKYRNLVSTDYFVTDTPKVNHLFKSAFPLQHAVILDSGYPRVEYLVKQEQNKTYQTSLKNQLRLSTNKKVLFYCPTWKDYDYIEPDFSALNDKYHILIKHHPESKSNSNGIDVSHLSTEDLLLISDVIVSDYSSVIFDAINIGKPVLLLIDDLSEYIESRGIYNEVLNTIPTIYNDRKHLIRDLNNDNFSGLQEHPYRHHHSEANSTIIKIIEKHLT